MITRDGKLAGTIPMIPAKQKPQERMAMAGKVASKEPKPGENAPTDGGGDYPPDPYPDYRPVYGWVFQSWLVMFLAVICLALVFYLLSYVPW
jgi:hypothetical protein